MASASFPINWMCRVLGVSQSGFFAWRERPACRRRQQDMIYLAHIRTAFALLNGTYVWRCAAMFLLAGLPARAA
jgi:putative transposase